MLFNKYLKTYTNFIDELNELIINIFDIDKEDDILKYIH